MPAFNPEHTFGIRTGISPAEAGFFLYPEWAAPLLGVEESRG